MRVHNTGTNQNGELVISFVSTTFVERRPPLMTVATHSEPQTKRDERRTMGVASGAHALHDGYTDLIYVMLPVWQAEFGLSYAAIGAAARIVRRHHGRPANSGRISGRETWRRTRAGRRHRARRSWLLSGGTCPAAS